MFLRRAPIPSGLVIPTPEVFFSSDFESVYNDLYKGSYKPPRQYIHVQPFTMDDESPDYDLDEEDIEFVDKKLNGEKKFQVDLTTVEDMLDRLEKNSDHSVITAKEAKLVLKEDDDLILAVYDYWVDKRLRLKQPLAPKVKRDNRSGAAEKTPSVSSANEANTTTTNPYVAFRRRTEKMQTRKNRKNDEVSYEKMLKLRRDLNTAVTLLEMVKRREKTKKDKLDLTSAIFEKRFKDGDFDGKIMNEILQRHRQQQRAFQNLAWVNQLNPQASGLSEAARQKRPYNKKKKTKSPVQQLHKRSIYAESNGPEFGTNFISSDDEGFNNDLDEGLPLPKELDPFSTAIPFFRRKRNCQYLAPALDENGDLEEQGMPWDRPREGFAGEAKYRYSLSSLSTPSSRCIGMMRRRVGRGGRIVLDRAAVPNCDDQLWRSLDFTVINGKGADGSSKATPADAAFSDWPHYRPVTPPHCQEEEWGEKYR